MKLLSTFCKFELVHKAVLFGEKRGKDCAKAARAKVKTKEES